jgi:hypothetical protein
LAHHQHGAGRQQQKAFGIFLERAEQPVGRI